MGQSTRVTVATYWLRKVEWLRRERVAAAGQSCHGAWEAVRRWEDDESMMITTTTDQTATKVSAASPDIV